MEYSFEYELSDDLVRRATTQFIRSQLPWRANVAAAAFVALVLLMVIYDPGLTSGVLAGAGCLLFLLIALGYILRVRRGGALLRKLPSRQSKCILDDRGVRVENALGSNHLE